MDQPSLCGVDDYPRRTCRVLGGVTWRKWWENLTDEVPRRSPVARLRISIVIRPLPKCDVRRRRARGIPWLSLLGDSQRVRRRSPSFFLGDQEDTPIDSGVDEPHGTGPVSPRVATASRSSPSFSGEATCVRRTDSTSGGLHTLGWCAHGGSLVCSRFFHAHSGCTRSRAGSPSTRCTKPLRP